MPKPIKGETRKQFVNRAIKYIKRENSGIAIEHAVAKAHGIWEQWIKKKGK